MDDGAASNRIRKLDNNTARIIYSSQVITSVISAVKELIENALDAKPTNVQLKLEDYGLDKLEVCDNGKGIHSSDIPYVTLPHYTSKIVNHRDLDTLETYGFRGEALGAICSISCVSITTKTKEMASSMTYDFNHQGKVTTSRPSSCDFGTTIACKDLFKNLPVRKQNFKNIKRRKEELVKLELLLKLYSVLHPGIRFGIYHNGCMVWQKTSVSDVRSALVLVWGSSLFSNMVFETTTDETNRVTVSVYIPNPKSSMKEISKTTWHSCFIAVNQRPIHSKEIINLVHHYFSSSISESNKSRYPVCFVSITVPQNELDVNLDPSKMKVLFQQKGIVISLLSTLLSKHYGPVNKLPSDNQLSQSLSESILDTTRQGGTPETVGKRVNNAKNSTMASNYARKIISKDDNESPSNSQNIFDSILDNTGEGGTPETVGKRANNTKTSTWALDPGRKILKLVREAEKSGTTRSESGARKITEIFSSILDDEVCTSTADEVTQPTNDLDSYLSEEGAKNNQGDSPRSSLTRLRTPVNPGSIFKPHRPSLDDLRGLCESNDSEIMQMYMNQEPEPITLNEKTSAEVEDRQNKMPNSSKHNKSPDPLKHKVNSYLSTEKPESSEELETPKLDLPEVMGVPGPSNFDNLGPNNPIQDTGNENTTDCNTDSSNILDEPLQQSDKRLETSVYGLFERRDKDLNSWSRGNLFTKDTVEPIRIINPNDDIIQETLSDVPQNKFACEGTVRESPTVVQPKKLSRKRRLDEKKGQTTLFELVAFRPIQKPLSAFEFFVRDVKEKVQAENEGISSEQLASLILKQWQQLDGKAEYERMAQKDAIRFEKQKENAIIQSTQTPKPPPKTKETLTVTKNERLVEFDLSQLKTGPKLKPSTDRLVLIGQCSGIWFCTSNTVENNIFAINVPKLQELVVYNNLNSSYTLTTEPLDKNILITESLIGGKLWSILHSMTCAINKFNRHRDIVDPKILKNGFRIRLRVDDDSAEVYEMADCLPYYGLSDLREILEALDANGSDVLIENCRPTKVSYYLQSEAVRIARNMPIKLNKDGVQDLLNGLGTPLTEESVCLHKKPLLEQVVFCLKTKIS